MAELLCGRCRVLADEDARHGWRLVPGSAGGDVLVCRGCSTFADVFNPRAAESLAVGWGVLLEIAVTGE